MRRLPTCGMRKTLSAPGGHGKKVWYACPMGEVRKVALAVDAILRVPSIKQTLSQEAKNGRESRKRNGSERAASLICPTGINRSRAGPGRTASVDCAIWSVARDHERRVLVFEAGNHVWRVANLSVTPEEWVRKDGKPNPSNGIKKIWPFDG